MYILRSVTVILVTVNTHIAHVVIVQSTIIQVEGDGIVVNTVKQNILLLILQKYHTATIQVSTRLKYKNNQTLHILLDKFVL